jgi:voltage-gated potassium channel
MPDLGDPVTRRFISAATTVLLVYCVAVPLFMVVEGLGLVDSIYFTTVSMTSVGYGDIVPHTVPGKLLTVALLLAAVSIFFYHVTHFGQFRERSIDPHVHKRIEMLRNLTSLQTGEVRPDEVKAIRSKMGGKAK